MSNPKTFTELKKYLDSKFPYWMALVHLSDGEDPIIETVGSINKVGGSCTCCRFICSDTIIHRAFWYGYDSAGNLIEQYNYVPNHV